MGGQDAEEHLRFIRSLLASRGYQREDPQMSVQIAPKQISGFDSSRRSPRNVWTKLRSVTRDADPNRSIEAQAQKGYSGSTLEYNQIMNGGVSRPSVHISTRKRPITHAVFRSLTLEFCMRVL